MEKDNRNSSLSGDNFRNIIQQMPVGITTFHGPTFVVEMANETYLQLVDRTKEQFIGKPLFESLPEVRPAVEPLLNQVYNTGVSYYGREFNVILNRYGHKTNAYFNFVYQALRDTDGNITGIVVVANDVTEQVESKQLLAESEKQFRNMVDQSPIPMTILKGKEMIIETANQSLLESIWRKELKDVQGRSLLEVFPELKEQKYPELLERVFTTGIKHHEKESVAYVAGDGGLRKYYLDYEYSPLLDTDGKSMGIIITVNDVTAMVEARQRIAEDAERLRLATEATRLAIWDLNLTNDIILHSPRLAEIFGEAPSVHITHPQMKESVHPDDRVNVVEKAFATALQTGNYFYEARVIWPDQTERWVRTSGKIFFDEERRPVRMLGTLMDITEEKMIRDAMKLFSDELERKVLYRTQELQQANIELEKINRELASFAYVSSHDLQEPLRKIQVFASFLTESEKDKLSAKGKDYLGRMENAAARMQQLIDDILTYSRNNNKKEPLESTDLNEVLAVVTEELKERIEEKNAIVEISPLPVVNGIKFQLQQLFINLFTNSIKFARKGVAPHIVVSASVVTGASIREDAALPGARYYDIMFSDNGIGFSPEHKTRIFDVFQRLHGRSEYEGTGIGLAICKRIVENHHGIIAADGEQGKGAVFHIYLPV